MTPGLSQPDSSCVGGILLGGHSRRMGGQPKHSLQLPDGSTLLDRALQVLQSHCQAVILLGRDDQRLHFAQTHRENPFVADSRSDHGPLEGIRAALASGIGSRYLLMPCDMPCVPSQLVRDLIAHSPQSPLAVIHCAGEAFPAIFPMRIDVSLLPIVEAQLDRGERAIHRLLKSTEVRVATLELPAAAASQLVNINTPATFETVFSRPAESE